MKNSRFLGVLRRGAGRGERRGGCAAAGWPCGGVRGHWRRCARPRAASTRRRGSLRSFWRCPSWAVIRRGYSWVRALGNAARCVYFGDFPFIFAANVVALRLHCRDMPSCPVFREPFLRRRGASLPERRVWRTLPWVSNLRFVRCRACHGSVGAFEARGGGAHQFREHRRAFSIGHRVGPSRRTPWSSVAARG